MVERVTATQAACRLIAELQASHGPELIFYQSGGCCDNSSPNCYLADELSISPHDIRLGEVGGVAFYISAAQYEYWQHTQLIIDAVDGEGGTFSLECGSGRSFITRSRLFTSAEADELRGA